MQLLIFIASGLFLGWSLGANDAANIFGTAVGSRMVKFKTAAIIAGLFVVLGAVFQGSGATQTISKLGAVDEIGGAFAVTLCTAIIVTVMTYNKLPVSTSQAIVGAIIGWCYFTSSPVDYAVLGSIAGSWVISPLLGAIFAALLYLALRNYLRTTKIHVIKLDSYLRYALIIIGAFGAYSLGANNVANVMGVFTKSVSLSIQVGPFYLGSNQVLFFLGGVSIALGIITYGKKVMGTVGNGILSLTPETACVVVLAQALVLFLFSSSTLSNFFVSIGLPPLPLVPVSSTQVVVGSLMGIGIIRGVQEVKFKTLGNIALGWILTPVLSGLLTFFSLFFLHNVFNITITGNQPTNKTGNALAAPAHTTFINIPVEYSMALIVSIIAILLLLTMLVYFNYRKSKSILKGKEKSWAEQMQYADFQKALSEIEVKNIQYENTSLASRLEEKRRELITYALNIGEQRQFLGSLLQDILYANQESDDQLKKNKLQEIITRIKQKMSFADEIAQIYLEAEKVHNDFPARLSEMYPALTEQEKKLTVLLRVGFSTKEIAPILNISTKSVEISRYRLRKKLNLKKEENLTQYIKTM